MIMTTQEHRLTLSQAARRVPPYPDGKHVSPSTVWRWIVHGVRGVKLESYPIGRRLFTTAEAIERFSRRLREAHDQAHRVDAHKTATARPRTDTQRQRDIERANRELKDAGV